MDVYPLGDVPWVDVPLMGVPLRGICLQLCKLYDYINDSIFLFFNMAASDCMFPWIGDTLPWSSLGNEGL